MSSTDDGHDDELPSRQEIQDQLHPQIDPHHDEVPSRQQIQDQLNPRIDYDDDDDDGDGSGCLPSPFALWLILAILLVAVVVAIGLAVGGVFSSSNSHPAATPTTHASSIGSTGSNPTECLTSGSTLPPSAPKIITQPYSQTCSRGSSFTISDAVSGVPLPTHQWQQSLNNGSTWTDIVGATAPRWTQDCTQTEVMRDKVSNSKGQVISIVVQVHVLAP